jgi:hypothetical protein
VESKVKPGDAELASAVSSALTVQIAEGWSPGHVKETQFIDKKRKRNLVEGIREGNVDPNDLDIDDLMAVEQLAHKYADTVAKAIQTKLRPPPVSGSVQDLMAGAKVFVDGNGLRIDLVPGSVTLVKNRNAADIMVADLANLSRRTVLAVGLNGGVVASPDFLSSNGRIGAAIVFKRATSIAIESWLCPCTPCICFNCTRSLHAQRQQVPLCTEQTRVFKFYVAFGQTGPAITGGCTCHCH